MSKKILTLIILLCVTLLATETKAQYTNFEHDGITRQYIYYQPESLNEQMPLVFVMHGYTGDAVSIKNYSQMNDFADQYGFAVCYPRGTVDPGGNRFWNVGYAFHPNETVDDVGYLTQLAQYLQQSNGLNPDYTFATGMSNGGEMCYMLACQGYDTFKAVAPVAGMILQDILDECDAAPAIPVFEIHGSQDGVTPLAGDPDNNDGWGSYPSIADTIEYFVEKNGCTTLIQESLPNTNTSDGSFVVSEKYTEGVNQNEVWYYKVVGGGHDWPGAFGNMDINAGEQAWLFFEKYINANLSNTYNRFITNEIQFFPNPTNSIVNIKSVATNQILRLQLFNTLGQQQKVNYKNNQLDFKMHPAGVYLLKIYTNNGTITKKIIRY